MSSKLKDALNEISEKAEITLGEIVSTLQRDSVTILCMIVAFPFLQPIPIPGISSVLGSIIILQGLGLIINGKPFLPNRFKKIKIEKNNWELIYKAGIKFSDYSKKVSFLKHPWANSRLSQMTAGISIILTAAFLSLPLPIPFSNFIPALGIFFLCLGLLEEDLGLLAMGHAIMVILGFIVAFSYQFLMDQLIHGFELVRPYIDQILSFLNIGP